MLRRGTAPAESLTLKPGLCYVPVVEQNDGMVTRLEHGP